MWFPSWLRRHVSSNAGQQRRRPAVKPGAFRPRLEVLEGRDVPSTLTVTNTLDSGKGSLRFEIAHLQKNDTIAFDPSLNGKTIELTSGELLIKQNLTINGPGAGQLTIHSNRSSRVFEVAAKVQVALNGLTISGGLANLGGGILNNGTLTVSGCNLSDNGSPYGGGICNYGGTMTVSGCTLSGNEAGYGGGICNYGGTMTVSGCTLSGNEVTGSSTYGAAICNYGGTLTVSGCTLSNNYANNVNRIVDPGYLVPGSSGGGIANLNAGTTIGTATIQQSTLSGNWAGADGGGIYNAGRLTISACTLSGNEADSFRESYPSGTGGAIYNASGGTLTVSGSTLSGNSAPYGGGIYISGGTVALSGCTLSGNKALDSWGSDIYVSAGTVSISGCTVSGYGWDMIDNEAGTLTASNTTFSGTAVPIVGPWTDAGGNTFE